jgi:hypothetical protein
MHPLVIQRWHLESPLDWLGFRATAGQVDPGDGLYAR